MTMASAAARALCVGLMMLVWSACSESRALAETGRRGSSPVPTCESNGQCGLTEQCDAEARVCTWREGWGGDCARNEECALGTWCHQGLCEPRTAVTPCPSGTRESAPRASAAIWGTSCVRTSAASGRGLQRERGLQHGAARLVPRCTEANASRVCAPGERCAGSRCVQCIESAECGPGFLCDAAGRCAVTPRCYWDRDCRVPLGVPPAHGSVPGTSSALYLG